MRCIAVLTITLIAFAEARGQQTSSFEHLELLVNIGDEVLVAAADGQVTKGKILELNLSSLSLRVNGAPRQFRSTEILEIRQRRDDSLRNGAKIGAWIGLGFGVLGGLAACHEVGRSGCAGVAVPVAAVYVGMGAAVGIGIDALRTRAATIYRPRATPAAKLGVSPMVNRGQKGIALSVSF